MLRSERLRDLLRDKEVSQAELARRVGVSQQTIGRLVTGGAYSSRYLHLIARALQTTPEYLSGETDEPESNVVQDHLSADERDLLDLFRGIAPKDRAAVLQIVRTMATSAATPLVQGTRHQFRRES